MKITDIISEYGNNPNDSSDPRVAGGVPQAVGNLKARRLARGGAGGATAPSTPAPTTAPATAPASTSATASTRAPIDDLLDAPDASAPKQQNKDSFVDKLGNVFNRYADGKSYAVGNFTNNPKDPTTGYELNKTAPAQSPAKQSKNSVTFPKFNNEPSRTYTKQGNAWVDTAGNPVTDTNLLQAINAQAKA